MKKFLMTVVLSGLASTSVFGAEMCSNQNETWNGSKCVTIGASLGAATASGIFSVKKYSAANSIEKQYTERIFQNGQTKSGSNMMDITRGLSGVTNGDRITVIYNLSVSENRQYHIELMESNASGARTRALSYASMALTATKTEISSNPDGTTSTTVVPDYAARSSYAAMSASAYLEATDYDRKATDARHGGAVPTYDLKEVVAAKSETSRITSEFTQERIDRGGKILAMERLPVEKFNMLRSTISTARGGLVGIAVGVGLAVEEAVVGSVAKRIDGKSKSAPKMEGYYGQGVN